MANYTDLKAAVAAVIKANGLNQITGPVLQNALLSIIDAVGTNSNYVGMALPATAPGTPDGNVFYLASTPGTYTNFGGTVLNAGELYLFKNTPSAWTAQKIFSIDLSSLATKSELNDFKTEILNELGTLEKIYDSSDLTNVGFIRPDGTVSDNTQYRYSDYLPWIGSTQLGITVNILSLSVSPAVFYDAAQNRIGAITAPQTGLLNLTFTPPVNTAFIRFSSNVSLITAFEAGEISIDLITQEDIDASIVDATYTFIPHAFDASVFVNTGFVRPEGTIGNSSSYSYSDYLDISLIDTLFVHTILGSGSVSPAVFYDENYNYISGYTGSIITETDFEIPKPAGAKYFRTSISNPGKSIFNIGVFGSIKLAISGGTSESKLKRVYLSTDGNDDNTGGSLSSAVATMNKAISLTDTNGEILIANGDYFDQTFDLSSVAKITGLQEARFIYGNRFTSATQTPGYTRIFQTPYTPTLSNIFLWQHDIPDENTVILIEERHPLHRGRRTRLPSTRIYRAANLAEIEATTDRLMWYQDAGILYFSKVDGSDLSINPIVIPSVQLSASSERTVEIQGISIMYAAVLTTRLKGRFKNMSVGMVSTSGAIRYDNTIGLTFENVEAYGATNDGFNGHTSGTYSRTSVHFINCYGHDNSDDGESCHEYADVYHDGGLYEYNGNAITPASGGHAICNNVIARKNGSHPWSPGQQGTAFSAQGTSLDGGISTNIYCFNCLSENNGVGFRGINQDSKFINCISKNDTIPFGIGEQINCITLP